MAYHPTRMAPRARRQSLKNQVVDNTAEIIDPAVLEQQQPLPQPQQENGEAEARYQNECIEPIFTASSIAVAVKNNGWLNLQSSQNVVTHVF